MKTFDELHPLVIQWGEERELFNPEHGATPLSQLRKFFEEFGEMNKDLNRQDIEAVKDGIGDCQVCLINYAKLKGIDLKVLEYEQEEAVLLTFSEIEMEVLPLSLNVITA